MKVFLVIFIFFEKLCAIVLAIVGNKCDLTDRIEVEAEEAEEYAKVQ